MQIASKPPHRSKLKKHAKSTLRSSPKRNTFKKDPWTKVEGRKGSNLTKHNERSLFLGTLFESRNESRKENLVTQKKEM